MTEEELIEALTEKEHVSWAQWMGYLFSRSERNANGTVTIPAHLAENWSRLAHTGYLALADSERQSRRDEVAHIMPIIQRYAAARTTDAVNHTIKQLVKRPLDLIDQAKLASSLAVLEARVNVLEKRARQED